MGTGLRLLGIGWYVALCILGGGLVGRWLDSWLDLSPVLTLLGVAAGLALATFGMYGMLLAVLSDAPDSTDQRKG